MRAFDSLEYTVGSDGSETLYNLNADPERAVDLAEANPAVTGALFELLPAVRRGEAVEVEIDEEMREWLRSLGYIR